MALNGRTEADMWAYILVPFGLFILLSPGKFVNFPGNSEKTCSEMIPFPNVYSFQKGDGGESDLQNVTPLMLGGPAMQPIRDARKKCKQSFFPHYSSSLLQTMLHAFLFVAVCTVARHVFLP